MNQLAIQNAVMANDGAIKGLRELFGQQATGSDAFAALIQQLLGGIGDEENLAMLMQQIDVVQKQDEEEGTDLAMQMMAGFLLSGNPQAQELLNQMGIELTPEQVVVVENDGQQNILIATPVQKEQPKGEQEEPMVFEVVSETRRAMGQPEDGESADMSLMQGRGSFQSAVYEARQKLAGTVRERTTSEPIDVDVLQAQVDARRFEPAVNVQKVEHTPQPETRNILEQLETGIKENYAANRDEFVIKLKPDGLGEITVKLVQKENSIALSILASSPQVARLISNEVVALQNVLRPLQAEVTQISVAPQAAEAAAQYAAFNEDGYHHQQFGGREQSHTSHRGARMDDSIDEILMQPELVVEDDNLDVYI
ncbi:flagellar hook-length control protein FliK [Anaerotruncus colihominis]|uniref:Flagellar hook-length control protein FliK n=1 Tax=Anaerotruncus colihominis TaxID=169435 RepID=A0A845RDX3_9FIRM|nr:flagellar hook-length control protein FliK [Anaerotruncus colihominis]NBI77457.1 flagellar hook-length control protein FliK [Anaerotruncus colihominis]